VNRTQKHLASGCPRMTYELCTLTAECCPDSAAPRIHHCRKRCGDEFWLGDVLKVLIVEVGARCVKLALTLPDDAQSVARRLPGKRNSAAVPRIEGPGYFVSPASGCYCYVTNVRTRTRLRINGAAEVTVDFVEGSCVELASSLPFQPPLGNRADGQ